MARGGMPSKEEGAIADFIPPKLQGTQMTAYHGTPHTFPGTAENPLGEFDPTKIGTGEGAQAYGHGLYFAENEDVAKEYPDVKTDYNHVDACCMWMVKNPDAYDVIVTTNMFGDIITDLGGILQGGMGVAAGANLNPDVSATGKRGVSMFEPMGGSAPKYTGLNQINPIAAINAMAMLLEHTGHPAAGARIDKAVAHVTGTKMKSQAAGKMGHGTREVGDLVVAAL